MTPGPFQITPVYCGKFSAAQQSEFGTTAKGGLIYKYADESNSINGAAKLDVDFTTGSTVDGENVSADPSTITPGQSSTAEVDAVGDSGQNLSFTGCQVNSYSVILQNGIDPTSYAG